MIYELFKHIAVVDINHGNNFIKKKKCNNIMELFDGLY